MDLPSCMKCADEPVTASFSDFNPAARYINLRAVDGVVRQHIHYNKARAGIIDIGDKLNNRPAGWI
jgi:hypothetical protein